MDRETIKSHVDVEEYFNKMSPEDAAAITVMCMDKLADKANELKELYTQLAKTYGFEMGVCGVTCIVQVSAKGLPVTPVQGFLGTTEGIRNGIAKIVTCGLKQLSKIEDEENQNDDKKQG